MPPKPYVLMELSADRRERKRQLKEFSTKVPPRSEGRSTDHTEIYSIVWMLRAIESGGAKAPLTVLHSDRPDFLLQSQEVAIGVEVVEAVSPNTASMDHLRETEPDLWRYPGETAGIYFSRKAVPGEEKLPAAALRELIADNEPGDGWGGTGVEEWTDAICHFALLKVRKAQGYDQFDQNWLLIYDNWDVPARNVRLSDIACHCALLKHTIFATFDRVAVLDSRSCVIFNPEGFRRRGLPRHCR